MRRILFVGNAGYIHTQRFAAHYRDRGIDVHIASFQPGVLPGVTVHALPNYGLGKVGFVLAVPRLRGLARRLEPDVIHAHYLTSYGFVSALTGLHPLVVTAWGTDVLVSPYESSMLRACVRYAVRHADLVTTVAAHMNRHVEALGIPAEKVHAVPFGVDTERFTMGEQDRRAGELRVICTRNFDTLYDLPTLIRAVARVATGARAFHLDLIGRGPLQSSIDRQVREAGLSSRVTFHGHVDHTRLAELLRHAHIFVTPAVSDGNNVSLNEAMACGCFPIATRIPANEQWLEHGRNGLLFGPGDDQELADCLRLALEDSVLRDRVRPGNRRIVEERASWSACIRRNDELYAEAMRRHRLRT